MRHVEQQSYSRNTHTHRERERERERERAATFKIRTSLLRVHETLQDAHTNVPALHCDNLDRIRSRLNSVHVHYFVET